MEKDITKLAVEALMDDPLRVEIEFEDRLFWRRIGLLKKRRVFLVKRTKLGVFLEISKVLHGIDLRAEDMERMAFDTAVKFAGLHGDDIVRVVALVLHNDGTAPRKTMNQIKRNCDNARLFELLQFSLRCLDAGNFTSSIILTAGMSLLKDSGKIAE